MADTSGGSSPRPRRLLTDAECRNAKPDIKPWRLSDGNGLSLRVMPSGSKLWQVRYFFEGKEKTFSIGLYAENEEGPRFFGLRAARDARNEIMRLVSEGRDPNVVKRQIESEEAAAAARSKAVANETVEAVATRWLARKEGTWHGAYQRHVKRTFEHNVFPYIGDLHIAEVTARMVLDLVLRPMENRGAVESAHRLRQQVSALYAFAEAEQLVPENYDPANKKLLKAMKDKPRVGHQPAIIDLQELRTFMADCEALPAQPTTRLAFRFIHLTVVRTYTLRHAQWSQFKGLDGPEPIWDIPGPFMKADRPFIIPLPRQAVEILNILRSMSGGHTWVFPNHRHAHKPISENDILLLDLPGGWQGQTLGPRRSSCLRQYHEPTSSQGAPRHRSLPRPQGF